MQLAVRIEARAEAALQVGGGGLTEDRQAELERVAAHGGVAHRARQRLHRDGGRGEIGVAGAEVDHIHALLEQPALGGGDLRHRIAGQRGQPLAELGHSVLLYRNLRSAFAARYRPLDPRYRPLPPSTAFSSPIPCRAKNSSQAPRTSAQSPTTRVARGSPSRIIAP